MMILSSSHGSLSMSKEDKWPAARLHFIARSFGMLLLLLLLLSGLHLGLLLNLEDLFLCLPAGLLQNQFSSDWLYTLFHIFLGVFLFVFAWVGLQLGGGSFLLFFFWSLKNSFLGFILCCC